MRVMRTVYVAEHSARLRVRKANLVVECGRQSTRVPLETVEAVVMTGRAEITNDAIGELVRRGVRIAAVSRGGRLRFWIGGATAGNVLLRLAQHEAASDGHHSLGLARTFVAGKLRNCQGMMRRWAWDERDLLTRRVIERDVDALVDRLGTLASASDGDTVRGVEGDGTRRYFKALGMHLRSAEAFTSFRARSRRPPRDPINALLSFTYGLVLTEVVGALDAVGLDPQVGYLHRPRPGRPSLALDVLEEFRPAIADRFCVSALARRRVVADDFEVGPARATYLSEAGRRKVLSLYDEFRQAEVLHPLLDRVVPVALLPSIQATVLARHVRGDLPAYAPYVFAGS